MTTNDEYEGLIDIDEIPGWNRTARWPYDEWEEKIAPGKAKEITKDIHPEEDISSIAATIRMTIRRRNLSIQCVVRNNRIWVQKPKEG